MFAVCSYVQNDRWLQDLLRALAQDLQNGLELMVKDGSFEKLFQQYNGKFIEWADLPHRRVIKIDNPFMPPETLKKFEKFWFNPAVEK